MAYDLATKKRTGTDYSCGLGGDDDVGSFVFPVAEQKVLYDKIDAAQNKMNNKIDDVRYDIRRGSSLVSAAVAGLAGGVAMLGIAHFWNAAKGVG